MNTLNAIKADTYRQFGEFSWGLAIKAAIVRRTYRVVMTMRLCQAVANSRGIVRMTLPLFRILHRLASRSAAVDLPWQTRIGSGLSLVHGWGLVISPGAKIGANVTLFHGATLGRRDRIQAEGSRQTGHPVLEDEVWVGPHAIIVGEVTIGRGSRVAGGAFVTESVPPYSIVLGNPATIVKRSCVPDVMNAAPL
jgi:serine O-acetyltransferase